VKKRDIYAEIGHFYHYFCLNCTRAKFFLKDQEV